jgi:integrase
LTCARTAEALEAEWSEVDFENRLWTVPATKMKAGVEHRQPLSDAAIELLRKLPREEGHPYLFVSAKAGRPLADSVLLKTMRRMGQEETTHGFRSQSDHQRAFDHEAPSYSKAARGRSLIE